LPFVDDNALQLNKALRPDRDNVNKPNAFVEQKNRRGPLEADQSLLSSQSKQSRQLSPIQVKYSTITEPLRKSGSQTASSTPVTMNASLHASGDDVASRASSTSESFVDQLLKVFTKLVLV
jgi:hypothetical protein